MIEKKYKNIPGFEDKDTLVQFDQWEAAFVRGGKNRYIYDFSDANPSENKNVWASKRPAVLTYGYPGDWAELATDIPLLDDPLVEEADRGLEAWPNLVPTINNYDSYEETCPYFEENAFLYIDGRASSAYDVPELADFTDFFRAGYAEFTIKTEKQNQIIASGSSELRVTEVTTPWGIMGASLDYGASITELVENETAMSNDLVAFDGKYFKATPYESALLNLEIGIKNGKLYVHYSDKYNEDNVDFLFKGNENVADNQWHHIVVNFGRPGLKKTQGNRFNKKTIEFWVDGQLDKRFDDKINDFNIFYPKIDFLFHSPLKMFANRVEDFETFTTSDGPNRPQTGFVTRYVGYDEFIGNPTSFDAAVAVPKNKIEMFNGAMHSFAHGINVPISKFEIQNRYSLWRRQEKNRPDVATASTEMMNASISTNKKKALKLFWNNLELSGKFGLELDDNFQVEAFSVTHQTSNSSTEIYNIDSFLQKEINIFENVRVAATDEVIIEGPGRVFAFNSKLGALTSLIQQHPKSMSTMDQQQNFDNLSDIDSNFVGERKDFPISGIILSDGDRILLTKQTNARENGIWIYRGSGEYLQRAADSFSGDTNKLNVVYVEEGEFANKYWKLDRFSNDATSSQRWSLALSEELEMIQASPAITTTWKNNRGEERFINILEDVDINKYDLISFMNYPETNDQIYANMPNTPESDVTELYFDFVNNIRTAAANGANIFVSSPKLAEDLGIIKKYSKIDQLFEADGDQQSATINPFQFDEPAERYFDTHRNNKYHLATVVPGLTDKQTWTMTDFINYIPEDQYDYEQWHIKYSYRPAGLQEGDEFYIPGLAMRERTDRSDLPGYRNNYRSKDVLYAVNPSDVLVGTTVTKLSNSLYNDGVLANNPYDDYVTTIIVYGGQQINGQPINGKIFINFTEDSYTYSREDYNKATMQVIPVDDPHETVNSRAWQYSTSRLNRAIERINSKELTSVGQTTPKLGGGGAFLQGTSNSSIGMIRSQSDKNKEEFQSDLYPNANEEVYEIQEMPVLSMTWLGLKWLIGE